MMLKIASTIKGVAVLMTVSRNPAGLAAALTQVMSQSRKLVGGNLLCKSGL